MIRGNRGVPGCAFRLAVGRAAVVVVGVSRAVTVTVTEPSLESGAAAGPPARTARVAVSVTALCPALRTVSGLRAICAAAFPAAFPGVIVTGLRFPFAAFRAVIVTARLTARRLAFVVMVVSSLSFAFLAVAVAVTRRRAAFAAATVSCFGVPRVAVVATNLRVDFAATPAVCTAAAVCAAVAAGSGCAARAFLRWVSRPKTRVAAGFGMAGLASRQRAVARREGGRADRREPAPSQGDRDDRRSSPAAGGAQLAQASRPWA